MKLRVIGILATAALLLPALAGTASASTALEVKGVTKDKEAVNLNASLKAGTSALLTDTLNAFANTCTGSTIQGATEATATVEPAAEKPYTGTRVGGNVTGLTFKPCKEEVLVDKKGSLNLEWINGTTNGTVRSVGLELTVSTEVFGLVTCFTSSTAPGTDLGTLTGVATGQATMDIDALLTCSPINVQWTATYVFTSPEGLGVTS